MVCRNVRGVYDANVLAACLLKGLMSSSYIISRIGESHAALPRPVGGSVLLGTVLLLQVSGFSAADACMVPMARGPAGS